MSTKTTLAITLVLILVAVVFSLSVYNQLPQQMASHWDVNDQVNGHMSRFWGAFLMPIITVLLVGLFLLIPAIDPLKANIAQFRSAFNLFILLMVIFMVYIHILTIFWNLGFNSFHISTALLPAMGLLFIFVGYLLTKAKRNFFIGIRTPWTLSSDTVWDETHSLGSKLFIGSGILAMIGGFFGGTIAFLFIFIPLIASSLFLVLYSYFLYVEETKL